MSARLSSMALNVISSVALLATTSTTVGAPPAVSQRLPGVTKGELETRWIAPYVRATTEQVGSRWTTSVRWFDPDGKVVREVSGGPPGLGIHVGGDYVCKNAEGTATIHAVNGDWKFVLPKKPGAGGSIDATPDSRTFVRSFHPKQGRIAIDVYVLGKLIGTIGPFIQYHGSDAQLGRDGSLALLTWKNEDKRTPQVVVAGPDAKVRFRVDCADPTIYPLIVAPGGSGVLVKSAPPDVKNTFTFYQESGKVSSLDLSPNPFFITWVPKSNKAFFHIGPMNKFRYRLIDWDTGKTLWDIPDPTPTRMSGSLPGAAVEGDHVLLVGFEFMKVGDFERLVYSIYALDVTTGEVVARWLPSPLSNSPQAQGSFLKLGERLFVVCKEHFAEITLADIAAKRNGWR